jgi:hypothetical protein
MAHKKGAGSTKNGRDSNAKQLELLETVVKLYRIIDHLDFYLEGYGELDSLAGLLDDVEIYLKQQVKQKDSDSCKLVHQLIFSLPQSTRYDKNTLSVLA